MSQSTVLLVDDNGSGRYVKARALRAAGYDVYEAGSAEEAINLLRRRRVHVAVLDVKLPDMHGFELCRQVKQGYPNISVLQTSATFTSAFDRVAGLEVGADAYLVEPMEETELVATVRALLRVRQAEIAQKAAELRLAQFVQASPDVFWIYNVGARRFEFLSAAAEAILGHQLEDLKDDPDLWFAQIHPDDRAMVTSTIAAAATDEDPPPIEYRLLGADHSERWIRDRVFSLPGDFGNQPRVAGLARDITISKLAQHQQELLINELNHRVKNTLAIVQSIASHTAHSSSPNDFVVAFAARLEALAKAHDLLTRSQWNGTTLKDALDAVLAPFLGPDAKHRIATHGPHVWLAPNTAVTLALAFHELATNATKYGALSNDTGEVEVSWATEPADKLADEPGGLSIHWRERGGPPVAAPSRKGFGSVLMGRVLEYETGGKTTLSFPATGVEMVFHLPLSAKLKVL
jgi:PAS domain S-box-containing protein